MTWKKIMAREYGVQYTEISLRSLTNEVHDLVPHTFTKQIYIPEENNQVCYIDEKEWETLLQTLDETWTVDNVKDYIDVFMQTGHAYVGYAKEQHETLSNDELIAHYLEYQRRAVRYAAFIWTVYILNEKFSEAAQQLIQDKTKNPEQHYETLLTPEKNASILELQARIQEENPEELYEQYKWIPCLDLHNDPWTKEEFLRFVDEHKQPEKEKIPYETLLKELNITADEKKLLDVARTFAYLKDYRDDFRRKGVYFARKSLFNEIAARCKCTLEELSYMLEAEIVAKLRGKPISIPDRTTGFTIYYDDNVIMCTQEKHFDITEEQHEAIRGMIASPGSATGTVAIVKGVEDLQKVQKGNILVAVTTHPDFLPAMQKAAAIVTDEGGITSHAAIVARELKIPCVVGCKTATKLLKDGNTVTVENGTVR
ncbi:MAG: PEP-utilizing enzyme [Candidatus Woesearchaeota archaeon]|nr:PEP-utilizing enzyme [Candidatus Woesearchaeota archaeon]